MKSSLRVVSLLACGFFLAAASCRRGPKPIPVNSATEARKAIVFHAVIPNLDRSFDRAEAVAKALSLPFDKVEYRKQFIQDLKAPEALLNALRTDGPVAIVVFPPKVKGKDPGVVVAATAKSAAALKSALAGVPQDEVKDEVKTLKLQAVPVWVIQRGGLLIGATSREALTKGAALAMETATASEEDMTVRFYPETMAKGEGTDIKSVIAAYIDSHMATLRAVPGQNPMVISAMGSVFKSLGDRLAEVDNVGVSGRIDAQKGASLRFEVSPRNASKLASLLSKTTPYALDTRVVPAGDAMMLMAFSPTELVASLWADLRGLVAKGKPGEDAAKQIDTLIKGWSFGGSGAVSVVEGQMRMTGIYGLRKGVNGSDLLAATEALIGGAWYQSVLRSVNAKVSLKRDKDLLVMQMDQSTAKNIPPAMAQAMKGMGLLSQTTAMHTTKEAFFLSTGKDAATQVKQLVAAKPREPNGLLATSVAETAGTDGFMYLDLGQFVKLGVAAMGAGKVPLFSEMRLPLWLSYRGGESATFEMRLPMELAKGVSSVIPMLMGLGMGGQPQMGL